MKKPTNSRRDPQNEQATVDVSIEKVFVGEIESYKEEKRKWFSNLGVSKTSPPDQVKIEINTSFSLSTIPIGLNTVPVGSGLRFGDSQSDNGSRISSQQVDDFSALGATILRFVGAYDFTWRALTGNTAIPRVRGAKEAAIEIGSRLIDTNENVEKWTAFFQMLDENNIQVILTCFAHTERLNSKIEDPDTYLLDIDGFIVFEPFLFRWSNDHSRSDVSNNYSVLDIRSAYEVTYVKYIAQGIGRLLASISDNLGTNGPEILSRTIRGLEIFSEIESFNVVVDADVVEQGNAEVSAEYWASAFSAVSVVLKSTLDEAGLDLPFFLPGLNSFYEGTNDFGSVSRNSWDYKMAFFSRFLGNVNQNLRGSGYSLSDMVDGINYRWAHRNHTPNKVVIPVFSKEPRDPEDWQPRGPDEFAKIGTRHICTIKDDLDEIKTILSNAHLSIDVLRRPLI